MTFIVSYGQEKSALLFGYPISHSLAPLLHNTLWDAQNIKWTYKLNESKDFASCIPLIDREDIIGVAVTMPFKIECLDYVDQLSEEARVIGSINTIYKRSGTVKIGTNTDCYGIRDAFTSSGVDIEQTKGKPGMVIGGGATTRSAVYALWTWFGVTEIYLVNRFKHEIDEVIEHFRSVNFPAKLTPVWSQDTETLATPAIIVSAVPDFEPKSPEEINARKVVESFLNREKGHLLEMCYHPHPETKFFKLAQSYKWNVIPGTQALIYQGIAQQVFWNEKPVPPEAIAKVIPVITKAVAIS